MARRRGRYSKGKDVLGIDEFIEFDEHKNEIRMEIPMSVLFDVEKNKGLGKVIDTYERE